MKLHLRTSMPMTLSIQGTLVVISLSALSFDQSRDERVLLLTITLMATSAIWLTMQEEKILSYRVKHLQQLLQLALSASPPPLVATAPEEPEEDPSDEEREEEEPKDWLYLLEQVVRQYNSPPNWPFDSERKDDEKGNQLL